MLRSPSPFYATYTSKHDGAEVKVSGNAPFDVIAVFQEGKNGVLDERKKTGSSYKATGETVFTDDGRLMTVSIKGAGADGKEFTQLLVFDRQ